MNGWLGGISFVVHGFQHFLEIYGLVLFFEKHQGQKSANSFFNQFIGRKGVLVEFCIRLDIKLKYQRQEELIDNNTSMHTNPNIFTLGDIESHGDSVFTHKFFRKCNCHSLFKTAMSA